MSKTEDRYFLSPGAGGIVLLPHPSGVPLTQAFRRAKLRAGWEVRYGREPGHVWPAFTSPARAKGEKSWATGYLRG